MAEKLYSESGGRFLITVSPDHRQRVEDAFQGLALACLGQTTSSVRLQVLASGGDMVLDEDVLSLKGSWKETLHGI